MTDDPRLKILDYQWFAERFLWIRDKSKRLTRLKFNRPQADFDKNCTGRDIVQKANQIGFTTYMVGRQLHRAITRVGHHALTGSRNREKAEENLARVRLYLKMLPPELVPRMERKTTSLITFPDLDSTYQIEAMQHGFGSGSTLSDVYMTEVVYAREARQALDAVIQAVPLGRGSIVMDSHYDVAILGGFFEETVQAAKRGESVFKLFTYDWPWVYSKEWAEEKRKEGLAAFAARYCCDPTQAGDPVYTKQDVLDAMDAWKQPDFSAFEFLERQLDLKKITKEGCEKSVAELKKKNRFLIGLDPAEGRKAGRESTKRDWHALEVIHLPSGAQVDEWSSRCHLDLVPREADQIARKWAKFGDVVMGVERNNSGHAVLKGLKETDNKPYKLYRDRDDGEYGWRTTAKSKPMMLTGPGSLGEALRNKDTTFYSERLKDEFLRFQYNDRGGMEAQTGQHDDHVIAYAIAWAMRSVGVIEAWT